VSTISKNITEFKRLQDKLPITDGLTGLYNGRGFFPLAEQQLKIASRDNVRLFLLYAEVDNWKQVSDTFGHLEGDQLIIRTAEILKDSFRNSDIISRIGEDTFVIFPINPLEGTLNAISKRLQDNIERVNEETTRQYSISLCIGKADFDPSKPCSIEELIKRADMSMYNEKISKNQY